jgi:hypothetical protein
MMPADPSLSLLPCQVWHGYMVTNAHRVEVEVGADGHASAPPSGAAAAAPLAGALRPSVRVCRCYRGASLLLICARRGKFV